MHAILLLSIGLFFPSITSEPRRDAPSSYSESYTILIKGVVAGTENVTEKTNANGEIVSSSEHEMLVSDGVETKRMAFSTRMVLSKSTGMPSSYAYWYTLGNTGDSYEVTIKNGQITRVLNRGGRSSEVKVPFLPDMVFLDFNVYHQYDYLIRRYDTQKGGRQTFPDFLPLIGNDVPVALTYIGDDKLDLKIGTLPIRNFQVEFVGMWGGTLAVNKNGRLVRLVIPSQELEVVRRDLLTEPKQ